MTITTNIAAKFAVAFVAVAMALTLVAPSAKAQDVSAMSLEQLVALVNQLQSQLSGSTTTNTGSFSYTFTRALGEGSTGADVLQLQKFLNLSADTQVAAAGVAGGPGAETSFYGPATAAAVSKFQVKYSAEILVPSGLTSPTGYFGPATMAKANALAKGGSTTTPGGSTSTGALKGGDADIKSVKVRYEENANNGSRNQKVASFEIDLSRTSGDIELNRVDLEITVATSSSENRLFRILEAVSIADANGKVLDTVKTSNRNDWNSIVVDGANNEGTLRIAGLKGVARGDARTEFQILVDTARLSDSDLPVALGLEVASIRYTEATGAIITETALISGNGDFSIEEENSASLRLRSASSNPAATIVKGDADNETKGVTSNVFTVESRELDFSIDTIKAKITAANNVVRRAELYVGNTRVASENVSGANPTVTFDLREYELRADRSEQFTVKLDLNRVGSGSLAPNGSTFQVDVTEVAGFDENDNDKTVSTTAFGKVHTLSLEAATVDAFAWSVNNVGTIIDFTFNVEADDENFVVDLADIAGVVTGNAPTSTVAKVLSVTGGDATELTATTFRVDAGRDASFRVRYSITASSSNNGTFWEVKTDTVSGQAVPNNKQTSPSATIDLR